MPKVEKNLNKLKHPNSRKVIALTKQIKRGAHRQKKKSEQTLKLNLIGEKIQWFKERLLPDVTFYTPDQVDELLQIYLSRFDDELEQIVLKHSIGGRKNRQHASREDIIRLNQKMELQEYNTCGIEMPDLLNTQQLKYLRNWNGELRYIQNFKLRRIGKPLLNQLREKVAKKKDNLEIEEKHSEENNEICNNQKMDIS